MTECGMTDAIWIDKSYRGNEEGFFINVPGFNDVSFSVEANELIGE